MPFGRFHAPSEVSLAFWWFPCAKQGLPRFLVVSMRQARLPSLFGGFHAPSKVSLAFWWFPCAKQGFHCLLVVSMRQARFPLLFGGSHAPSKVSVGEIMLVAIGVVWGALWTLPWAKPGFPCFLVVSMRQARVPLLFGCFHGPSQVSLAFW